MAASWRSDCDSPKGSLAGSAAFALETGEAAVAQYDVNRSGAPAGARSGRDEFTCRRVSRSPGPGEARRVTSAERPARLDAAERSRVQRSAIYSGTRRIR